MAAESTPKIFRIKRLQIGANILIQVFTLCVIIGAVNYLGFSHYRRWDFSRTHRYALSDQTRRVLKTLQKPLNIIVFFSTDTDITEDVESLLKEYQYASRKKVDVEIVDPYRNLTRARELQAKYKFGKDENILILDYDGRNKFINAADLADYDASVDPSQPARVRAFKG